MKQSRELRDFLLGVLHDAFANLETYSSSAEAVFIGTGPGEIWVGGEVMRTVMRLQRQEFGDIRITPGAIYSFEEGTVGWACGECTTHLPNGIDLPMRVTLVVHREGAAWKLVHGHVSHAADNLETWGLDIDLTMENIARFVEQDRPDLGPLTSAEGTITIVFTDMEASTATNEAMGDDKFLPLLLQHHDILQKHTTSLGGSVVKSQGDGFMLAFSSARRAVDCAIAVQRQIAQIEGPIKVRMGLHTGEPVRHSDDFYGRDVAYAARLGSAAMGGEILVSSLVKSLVEPSGSVTFEGPRQLELKGFAGPQPVFAVVWR